MTVYERIKDFEELPDCYVPPQLNLKDTCGQCGRNSTLLLKAFLVLWEIASPGEDGAHDLSHEFEKRMQEYLKVI